MTELYLGTGGYSNTDWLGLLYPEGTKNAQFLSVYAQHYNAVELNSSFYAIPGIKAFEGMVKKSNARVRFSVKAHQSMTHTRDADNDMYQRLKESVQPLRDAGMLGPFLVQFPYSFHRTPENRLYLKDLVDKLAGEQIALEFRHASWDNAEVREAIAALGLTAVTVDYPPLRGLPSSELHITNDTVYLRLHGRNKDTWWDAKSASQRHDYRYSMDELRPFVLALKEHEVSITQAFIMMLNTTKGHALYNLQMIKQLCDEIGLDAPIQPDW